MPLFRKIGSITTIATGSTQSWHYNFPDNLDVGLQIAGPDIFDERGNLVAFDQGIEFEIPIGVTYHVKIKNEGGPCVYRLQIGGFV